MKTFAIIALMFSSLVMADHHHETFNYSKKWGIGASFGYNTPVFGNIFNNAADGDQTWGAHVRYHLNSTSGLEAAFTKHEFSDTTVALQVTDVTWFKRLRATERLSPILGIGAGVVDIPHYGENNLKLGLKLRGGVEYALTKCLSLGLNVDYQQVNKMLFADNLDGRNIHVLSARAGLTWYFGGAAAAAATALVEKSQQVLDADTDKDGVIDSKDKCQNTPAGTVVTAYGCAAEEKATVHLKVMFATGKTTIAPEYDAELKELALFMTEHPTTKIEIQGHTDSSGSKVVNKKLSQSRAESVRSYLVKELKADPARVTAKGYGDEQPLADNDTAEGKAKNRRVIAVIE